MAQIEINKKALSQLRDKVVIITGGANGIGKATVSLLHQYGAKIVIGDLDTANGENLLERLGGDGFVQKTDVRDWRSLRSLFVATRAKYGRIDVVFANAGMPERDGFLLDETLDEDGELAEPGFDIMDVNVNGVLRTAKLAFHHFAKNPVPGGSLVMTGSAASYFAGPPIIRYTTAKHALVGILRSLSSMTEGRNIRVNLVAPWMTETEFSSEVSKIWGDLPKNTSKEVAEALCLAASDENLHGRTLYVAKGVVDFELALYKLQSQWMTTEQAVRFDTGRQRLAAGMGLPTAHYFSNYT
jgi:NAD(P)-dependent dehydrogenase (short-subunit alcohol dehydrogenase family)